MGKLAGAGCLTLGLLLISGCSNNQERLCSTAKSEVINYQQSVNEYRLNAQRLTKDGFGLEAYEVLGQAQRNLTKAQNIIIDNPQCFTAKEVTDAQTQSVQP